jgi:hypothetical protein
VPDCGAAATTIVSPVNTVSTLGGTIAPPADALSFSWADLGITPEAGRLLAGSERHLLFSADGTEFVAVGDPVEARRQHWDARVIDVAGSFVVSISESSDAGSTTRLFRTTDGSSWNDLGAAPFGWFDSFGAIGERIVMSGYLPPAGSPPGPMASAVAVRELDGTWRTVSLDGLVLPSDGAKVSVGVGAFAIGPNGITGVGHFNADPIAEMGGVEIERNGITLRAADSSGNMTFTAEDGRELGRIEMYGATGPLVEIDGADGSYDVRTEEGGEVVATFFQDEIYKRVPETGIPQAYVLHSTDGLSWSRERLSDLVGAEVGGTGGVRVTDTQVIVAANLAGQLNPNGTARQTLLVGTPVS